MHSKKNFLLSLETHSIPSNVCVIAVTKGQTIETIEPLLKQGHRWFGENKAQEIDRKWPTLSITYPDIHLQFIGRLQRNKVHTVLSLCHSIASIDRISLVHEIVKQRQFMSPESIKAREFLIQINFGNESQKGGFPPEDLHILLKECEQYNLPIHGLMTIPPSTTDPRPFFKKLRSLCTFYHLPICNMGMSDDYDIAMEEGATHIRLGRSLFKSTP